MMLASLWFIYLFIYCTLRYWKFLGYFRWSFK